MRWESDFATLATLPRLSIASGANSQAWSASQQRISRVGRHTKAIRLRCREDRVYADSSKHWFGFFSKVCADGLAAVVLVSSDYSPFFNRRES